MLALAGLVAFALTILCCENAERLGRFLRVVDQPDHVRKKHGRATPLIGGLAVALPLAFLQLTWLATSPSQERLFLALLATTCGFWALGFLDDRYNLRPLNRLVAASALFLVVIVLVEPQMQLRRLDFGPHLPVIELGNLAIPFTLLCLVGLVNAINMADGKNGVVLGMAICWSYAIAEYSHDSLDPYYHLCLIVLATVITHNWAGRLFLGDSGSYVIGALLGLQTIYIHNDVRSAFPLPAAALWLLFPVLDCLRLILLRLRSGRSPFSADLHHLHHYLERRLPWHLALPVYLTLSAGPGFLALLWPELSLHLLILTPGLYVGLLLWNSSARVTAGYGACGPDQPGRAPAMSSAHLAPTQAAGPLRPMAPARARVARPRRLLFVVDAPVALLVRTWRGAVLATSPPAAPEAGADLAEPGSDVGRDRAVPLQRSAPAGVGLAGPRSDHAPVDVERPLEHDVEVEVLDIARPARSTEPASQLRIGEKPAQPLGQRRRIAALHEKAGAALDHGLADPGNVRGDHRQAGAHRLERAARKSLPVADQDEDVGSGQQLRHVVALAEEVDPLAQAMAAGQPLDLALKRPVADQPQPPLHVPEPSQGAQECAVVLLHVEAAQHHDPRGPGSRAFAASVDPNRKRRCGRG